MSFVTPYPSVLKLFSYSILTIIALSFSFELKSQVLTSDKNATLETQNLYWILKNIPKRGILFGHQDDLSSGIYWKHKSDSSDIKKIVGRYPAVFGWDIGKVELNTKFTFEAVYLDSIVNYVKKVHEMGGINTVSWLAYNPLDSSKNAKGKVDSTIKRLFEDSLALARYDSLLNNVAVYLQRFQTNSGRDIPIILRLFHEHNGSWFWWGRDNCTVEEYVKLWRYTVDYFREKKRLHNILYAYSTDKFSSKEEYLERYPGDKYVDIIGADIYDNDRHHDAFIETAKSMVKMLNEIGRVKSKPSAIMETGYQNMPLANWWTKTLFPVINKSGLSYILIWRNSNPRSFWGTYSEHFSEDDFKVFANYGTVLFQPDIKKYREK